MLPLEEEQLKILTALGLTVREAKIYFTLNRIGKATIKNLSAAAKMDRPNVYSVVAKLQKLNLIEQMLTAPIVYMAVPFGQGVQMLLEHKKSEFNELSEATKELLKSYKPTNTEAHEENKLMIIPKETPTEKKFEELFAHTEKLNEAVCYWPDPKISLYYLPIWKKMLKKHVEIRLIVYLPSAKELPKSVIELMQNPSFKMRFTNSPPKIALSIHDQREAFLSTSMSISESSHLWVKSVGFVSFFQDYFDMLWQNCTETNPNTP